MQEPLPPQPNRMEVHLRVIAVVNLVLAVLAFIAVFALLWLFGLASFVTGHAGAPSWVPSFLVGFGLFLVLIPAAYGILALMAGLHLNARRRSGRSLAIVTAALSLFSFPVGTAFGIYAIWALMQNETEALLS